MPSRWLQWIQYLTWMGASFPTLALFQLACFVSARPCDTSSRIQPQPERGHSLQCRQTDTMMLDTVQPERQGKIHPSISSFRRPLLGTRAGLVLQCLEKVLPEARLVGRVDFQAAHVLRRLAMPHPLYPFMHLADATVEGGRAEKSLDEPGLPCRGSAMLRVGRRTRTHFEGEAPPRHDGGRGNAWAR